ncbi:O-antigen ligase family protein, partial [Candidatus Peregrinibacteria bacterium]|nr:O-antigen ligase family protein [Candidatus Peregrinibacteria bacterium]
FTLSEASPRFWTWGSAIKGWKERPILGWGPENFSVVFDKYFDPRHFVPGKSTETWFDRAHSIYFDYLAETGVIGLSSFLAIFVVLYWLIIKSRNNGSSPFAGLSPFQQAAVVALPVTYLVQGIVLFDILPTYLNLFLLFGFINYLTNDFSADHA